MFCWRQCRCFLALVSSAVRKHEDERCMRKMKLSQCAIIFSILLDYYSGSHRYASEAHSFMKCIYLLFDSKSTRAIDDLHCAADTYSCYFLFRSLLFILDSIIFELQQLMHDTIWAHNAAISNAIKHRWAPFSSFLRRCTAEKTPNLIFTSPTLMSFPLKVVECKRKRLILRLANDVIGFLLLISELHRSLWCTLPLSCAAANNNVVMR